LERFDFAFDPKIKRDPVTDLATCLFVKAFVSMPTEGPALQEL